MTVTLYKMTSDPRCLTKSFVQSGGTVWTQSFGVANTDNIDMLNPTICLAYSKTIDNTNQTIDFSANYAKIDTFDNRYYFIKDISVGTGGKIYLNLAIDVLYTYANSIRSAKCCITRSEDAGINWVPDSKFPFNSLNTITKGESGLFKTPFGKNPSSPWILSTINDNGAVHTTPTPPNNNE